MTSLTSRSKSPPSARLSPRPRPRCLLALRHKNGRYNRQSEVICEPLQPAAFGPENNLDPGQICQRKRECGAHHRNSPSPLGPLHPPCSRLALVDREHFSCRYELNFFRNCFSDPHSSFFPQPYPLRLLPLTPHLCVPTLFFFFNLPSLSPFLSPPCALVKSIPPTKECQSRVSGWLYKVSHRRTPLATH